MKQSAPLMQPIRILCAGVLACTVLAKAQTQTNAPGPLPQNVKVKSLTLEEAIQMALKDNFDIKILRFSPEIAEFNLRGSYGVYDPQVALSATHSYSTLLGSFNESGVLLPNTSIKRDDLGGTVGPTVFGGTPIGLNYSVGIGLTEQTTGPSKSDSGNWSIQLTQPLLRDFWIDANRAQIQINKKALKISELTLLGQIQLTVNSVEQAYYNLIFARENVKVVEKSLELAQRTAAENKKRVEVGALAPLDEKEAESQVATSQASLLEAKRSLDAQENVLKSLIVGNYTEWHDVDLVPVESLVAVPATYDLQESWTKGLTLRPDIQQAKVDLESRNITLKYQKNQLFPLLDLVGSYGLNARDTSYGSVLDALTRDDAPAYSYGVRLTIPLGNITARNRYKATKSDTARALMQLKKLEQDVMVQIDDAVKQAQTAFRRIDSTRQARLFAEAALDATQKKLENGKSTSFEVLSFQSRLTSALFEEIRALAEYNNALAALAYREGTTLQRHHLDVNFK